MIELKNIINREKFCLEVSSLVDRGTTYLDAIMTVKERYDLHEKEVGKLLDVEIQASFHQELINRRMLKEEDDD